MDQNEILVSEEDPLSFKTSLSNGPIHINEILRMIFDFIPLDSPSLFAVSHTCAAWRERSAHLLQWGWVWNMEQPWEMYRPTGFSRDTVVATLRHKWRTHHPRPIPCVTPFFNQVGIVTVTVLLLGIVLLSLGATGVMSHHSGEPNLLVPINGYEPPPLFGNGDVLEFAPARDPRVRMTATRDGRAILMGSYQLPQQQWALRAVPGGAQPITFWEISPYDDLTAGLEALPDGTVRVSPLREVDHLAFQWNIARESLRFGIRSALHNGSLSLPTKEDTAWELNVVVTGGAQTPT